MPVCTMRLRTISIYITWYMVNDGWWALVPVSMNIICTSYHAHVSMTVPMGPMYAMIYDMMNGKMNMINSDEQRIAPSNRYPHVNSSIKWCSSVIRVLLLTVCPLFLFPSLVIAWFICMIWYDTIVYHIMNGMVWYTNGVLRRVSVAIFKYKLWLHNSDHDTNPPMGPLPITHPC